jgi:hypothetical protein
MPSAGRGCIPWCDGMCSATVDVVDGTVYHRSAGQVIAKGAGIDACVIEEVDGTRCDLTLTVYVSQDVERTPAEVRRLATRLLSFVDEVTGDV